jgi:outer membrane protein TolC
VNNRFQKRISVLFGFIILFPFPSFSEEPVVLSLSQAIRNLENNNPTIKSKTHMVSATKAQAISQTMLANPNGSLLLRNQPVSGGSIGPQATVVGMSQMIPFPTKFFVKGSMGSGHVDVSKYDLADTHSRLIFQLRAQYAHTQQLFGVLKWVKKERSLLASMLRGLTAKVEAGLAKRYSLFRVKLELTQLKEKELQIYEQIAVSQHQLTELMAVSDNSFKVMAFTEVFQEVPLQKKDVIISSAMRSFSMKRKMEAEVRVSKSQETLAGQWWLPDIMVSGNYGFRPDDIPGNTTDSWSVGVALEIPLWFSLQDHQKYRKAYKTRLASEQKVVEVDLALKKNIRNKLSQIKQLTQTLGLYKKEYLPDSQSIQQSAENEYQVGRISFDEYLNASLAHPRKQQKWQMKRAAYDAALAELAYFSGEPKSYMRIEGKK